MGDKNVRSQVPVTVWMAVGGKKGHESLFGGSRRSSQAAPALWCLDFLTTSSPTASIPVQKRLCHRDDKSLTPLSPLTLSLIT